MTEAIALRFRAEFFNIFNYPNFGRPHQCPKQPAVWPVDAMLANSIAGGNNVGFNPLYQMGGGPRSIQLALKIQF
jgi:hypothetical protein